MPTGLKRYYGDRHLHFITTSCHRRQRHFASPRRRDCFLRVLEEVRTKFRFLIVGYVVMPEHVHLLITEPEIGDPSQVMAGGPHWDGRPTLRDTTARWVVHATRSSLSG